jgi:hypothetical protein
MFCAAFFCLHNFQIALSSWAIVIISYGRFDVIANVLAPKLTLRKSGLSLS